jgi:hypothetical protein
MRLLGIAFVIGLCFAAAFGCAKAPPPAGRWQGSFESRDTIVVARLEIDAKGNIFLCAPDATDIAGSSGDDRAAIRQRLSDGMNLAWGQTEPKRYEFDGRVFRKPGGVAPQLEWDPDQKSMTAVVYLGLRAAIRVPLHPVTQFTNDAWSG